MISDFKIIELRRIQASYNRYCECDENFHCYDTKTDVMCEKLKFLTSRILKIFAHSNSAIPKGQYSLPPPPGAESTAAAIYRVVRVLRSRKRAGGIAIKHLLSRSRCWPLNSINLEN